MPSSVAAIPPDGSPASKSASRANWTTTKAEMEHGGFVTAAVPYPLGTAPPARERFVSAALSDNRVNVRDYWAIGDGTSHPVSQWLTAGSQSRGYANLAAIQVDYPHVSALTDEIDWAVIQLLLDYGIGAGFGTFANLCRTVFLPYGKYFVNKSVKVRASTCLEGEHIVSTYLVATAAMTGPTLMIEPTPIHATAQGAVARRLVIDNSAVPEGTWGNHGVEIVNAVNCHLEEISTSNTKGNGIVFGKGVYFCSATKISMSDCRNSAICLRPEIQAGQDGYGSGSNTANANRIRDVFVYNTPNLTPQQQRWIEIYAGCDGNIIENVQSQNGIVRMDDGCIYINGLGNVVRFAKMWDPPGTGRTIVTSSGTASVIRCTLAPGARTPLSTGNKVTLTGVTGATPGTLYTVTRISDAVFDLTGTTYSGSPQTGRYTRAGSITATRAPANGATVIECVSANHGLKTGQRVTVTGITGGTGLRTAIEIDYNTFQLAGTTFGGSTQTGSWVIDDTTSMVRFSDAGNSLGYRNYVENISLVADNDPGTDIVCYHFLNGAYDNVARDAIRDQAGPMRLYRNEGSPHNEVHGFECGYNTLLSSSASGTPLARVVTDVGEYGSQYVKAGWGVRDASSLANGARHTGLYQQAYIVGGAWRTGSPMMAWHGYTEGLRMRVQGPNELASNRTGFEGCYFSDTDTNVTDAHGEIIREGFVDVLGMNGSGIAEGAPIYATAAGFSATPPSTGYAVVAGFKVAGDAGNTRIMIRPNYHAWNTAFGRLGMYRRTTAPALADLNNQEIQIGVVAGVPKLYWRDGANLYTFTGT